ncbi:putative quinol monooxygenase [Herbaspirillum lusitanum]|jgi:quinol monooxygenase YgiN|uniref:Quinol monooxygenase n=1 Tax=Herbaspirillum lusitanum TaxID=213312 RepID=A0ABW9ADB3_9BURK
MSLAVVVDFLIKPQHAEDFAVAILKNARASAANEPGCRQFDVCRDPDDACRFFLYELYDDHAAIEAHRSAPHYLAMQKEVGDWIVQRDLRVLQRV